MDYHRTKFQSSYLTYIKTLNKKATKQSKAAGFAMGSLTDTDHHTDSHFHLNHVEKQCARQSERCQSHLLKSQG